LKSEERLETLTELGLTNNQARAYLALLQCNSATAKELAKQSKIARPDIYRVIPLLQKEGLVEKLMTQPTSFRAIPPKYVLPILLKHKSLKHTQLEKKTEELLLTLKENHSEKKSEETTIEVSVVSGKEVMMQKLRDSLLNAQYEVCVVTSCKRFSGSLVAFGEEYQKALDMGVKIRIAIEHSPSLIEKLKASKSLWCNPDFEVRLLSAAPPTVLAIFDDRETIVAMSPLGQLGSAPALWSNNHSLIVLARSYFENQWHNSIRANINEPLPT
jgi:sugar-specific transcriptional regulator TrmB